MIIDLHRDILLPTCTLGRVSLDGKDFGYSCEDEYGSVTIVPEGEYRVTRTWSPKFQQNMMLVNDVPGKQGIRIHWGNTSKDTEGCVLVGIHRTVTDKEGSVSHSVNAWEWLDKEVTKVLLTGTVSIRIHR